MKKSRSDIVLEWVVYVISIVCFAILVTGS